MLQIKVTYKGIKSFYGWEFQRFTYLVNYLSLLQLISPTSVIVTVCNVSYLKMLCLIYHTTFKHPVQVPRWDAPRYLPRSINLLKLPLWFQIIPLRPINMFSTPVLKRGYPRWYLHIACLTIWQSYNLTLFIEFWLVGTWFFAHWRHQRAVTRLENVHQLNIRRDKKLGFQLSHKQPLWKNWWPPLK